MKYIATLNGKKYEVELEKVENSFRPLTREQISGVAPVVPAAPARVAVPAPVAAAPAPVAPAHVVAAPAPVAPAPAAGSATVLSPMPGTILDVKAAVGASVKAGQVLVVMEAMKMENEIVAPVDGVVKRINVKKGDQVNTDDLLVEL